MSSRVLWDRRGGGGIRMTDLHVVPSLGGNGLKDAAATKASEAQRRARSARISQKAEGAAAAGKRKAASGAKGKTTTQRTAVDDEKERKRMKRYGDIVSMGAGYANRVNDETRAQTLLF